MLPYLRSLLSGIPNQRRLADNIQPEEIVALIKHDEDQAHEEPAQEKPAAGRSMFDCFICKSDSQTTVATLCGHLFCYDCLDKSLRINEACPLCKQKCWGFIRLYRN